MPTEASMYDAHVEEVMDLRDGLNSYHVLVLTASEDGVIDSAELSAIVVAFGATEAKANMAVVTAERIAAAMRLVRSLFYTGPTAWVRRIAREADRDLERALS
jgi:uncharacterized membrane protein